MVSLFLQIADSGRWDLRSTSLPSDLQWLASLSLKSIYCLGQRFRVCNLLQFGPFTSSLSSLSKPPFGCLIIHKPLTWMHLTGPQCLGHHRHIPGCRCCFLWHLIYRPKGLHWGWKTTKALQVVNAFLVSEQFPNNSLIESTSNAFSHMTANLTNSQHSRTRGRIHISSWHTKVVTEPLWLWQMFDCFKGFFWK